MSSSELKLYFITYYRPLVYFEVFSIYLSVFHEFMYMWSPQKSKKKNFLDFLDFLIFFLSLFSREGGQLFVLGGNGLFSQEVKYLISTFSKTKIFLPKLQPRHKIWPFFRECLCYSKSFCQSILVDTLQNFNFLAFVTPTSDFMVKMKKKRW